MKTSKNQERFKDLRKQAKDVEGLQLEDGIVLNAETEHVYDMSDTLSKVHWRRWLGWESRTSGDGCLTAEQRKELEQAMKKNYD